MIRNKFRSLFVMSLLLWGSLPVRAEEESSRSTGEAASASEPENITAQSTEGSLSSSSESSEEDIGPLEPWIPTSSSERPVKSSSSEESSSSTESESDQPLYYIPESEKIPALNHGVNESLTRLEPEPGKPFPWEYPSKLSRVADRRLLTAKRSLMKRGRKYRREYRRSMSVDPRGAPELVLCTVNLNGYGTKEEGKKILKQKPTEWLAREKDIVSSIQEVKCDVVALQGIIGRTSSRAQEGLDRFLSRLNKSSPEEWSGFLGETQHIHAYNGFIYRSAAIEIIAKRHHSDLFLPRFDQFVTKQFYRGPIEFTFRVPNKNSADSKIFTVTTMDFQDSLKTGAKEPEFARMQMAEALIQIHEKNEEKVSEFNQPIFVILGDRAAGSFAPSARILAGEYRLAEFKKDGRCHLNEAELIVCNDTVRAPQKLFPLLKSAIEPRKLKKIKQKDGTLLYREVKQSAKIRQRKLLQMRKRTDEIYLSPHDIQYLRVDPSREGVLRVGTRAIKNGLSDSPLLWAEFNW